MAGVLVVSVVCTVRVITHVGAANGHIGLGMH
jgi:hypothetical protein